MKIFLFVTSNPRTFINILKSMSWRNLIKVVENFSFPSQVSILFRYLFKGIQIFPWNAYYKIVQQEEVSADRYLRETIQTTQLQYVRYKIASFLALHVGYINVDLLCWRNHSSFHIQMSQNDFNNLQNSNPAESEQRFPRKV